MKCKEDKEIVQQGSEALNMARPKDIQSRMKKIKL